MKIFIDMTLQNQINACYGDGSLPDGILVAWYGDDFTGAAAVMEVLAFAGLPSMLFLEPPTVEQINKFPSLRCIGVASTARSQSPLWMREELPEVFGKLCALKPELLHYKICSTLDSSPETGSIGCAIEIGADLVEANIVPILVAAPQMRRYQIFGQLFAAHGGQVHRLDRHPVMARHPVTPMSEADVALHLEKQSDRIIARPKMLEKIIKEDFVLQPFVDATENKISAVAMDSWDAESETAVGKMIWENRSEVPFVVGSQGVEYALVRHWLDIGALPPVDSACGIGKAERMVSVSGSVSLTTAEQIAWSKSNGFACIPFDATNVCRGEAALRREENRVKDASLAALADGLNPLIHTAEGPDDPLVHKFRAVAAESGLDLNKINRMIGEALGRILFDILKQSGIRRAVISGGDTSGYATRQIGVYALSALAPTSSPGASIFKTHAEGPMNGLELALKGGQMGSPDYFGQVRDGGGAT